MGGPEVFIHRVCPEVCLWGVQWLIQFLWAILDIYYKGLADDSQVTKSKVSVRKKQHTWVPANLLFTMGKRRGHQHRPFLSSLFAHYKPWTPGHRKPTAEVQAKELQVPQFSPSPHLVEAEGLGKEHITLFCAVKDEKEMALVFSCAHWHALGALTVRVTC